MILNRIKLLRLSNGLKQEDLARKINVSQASLSGYENNKFEPDQKTLLDLAAYFNVTTDYLLGNDENGSNRKQNSIIIPVFRYIQTDHWITSKQQIVDYVEISRNLAALGEFVAYQIQEDEMEPQFQCGDIVIVRRQQDVESGDVAIVQIKKNIATVKKLIKHDIGILLVSFNSKHTPMLFTNEQIQTMPITILGKVVELRRKC